MKILTMKNDNKKLISICEAVEFLVPYLVFKNYIPNWMHNIELSYIDSKKYNLLISGQQAKFNLSLHIRNKNKKHYFMLGAPHHRGGYFNDLDELRELINKIVKK